MLEKCETPPSQHVLLRLSKGCTMQGYSKRSHLSPRTSVYEHETGTDLLQMCASLAYLPSGQTARAKSHRARWKILLVLRDPTNAAKLSSCLSGKTSQTVLLIPAQDVCRIRALKHARLLAIHFPDSPLK